MIRWNWIKNKRPIDISLKSRMEGNILLVYGKTLEIIYLNKISARILKLSDGSHSLEDIMQILLDIYAVEEYKLKLDIISFIRELQWKRIIKLEE
ncbi:PqqD family protein [Anaerovibrio lipolyticus]|uniref:PqqD family protein n=1 Tax=Anaerovibrio lipolyticus TaxID=82374 RepID=UPI001F37B1D7|nr:PqqD family protein [Anaerovibrio lipolyticus]MCF2601696.1 PqqD family protein [Anaerovibrio lipolyticus]